MHGSAKSLPTTVIVALLGYAAVGCGAPAGVDLDEEAASIPWALISGKIAYSRNTPSADGIAGSLFIIDGNSRTLSLVKESDHFLQLAWKTDGTSITFARIDARWQLYSINADGSTETVIDSLGTQVCCPAWSRDGRLAYSSTGAIFIDGLPFLTGGSFELTRPAWSPDSRFLVVARADATSQGSLYRVSLSDTTVIPLLQGQGTYDAEIFDDPIYSPDGSKIAFYKRGQALDRQDEIWIMNADGTNPTRLTSGHEDYYPAWSPDGNTIMFYRQLPTGTQLFLVDADGGEVTQVTRNGGEWPTWIP